MLSGFYWCSCSLARRLELHTRRRQSFCTTSLRLQHCSRVCDADTNIITYHYKVRTCFLHVSCCGVMLLQVVECPCSQKSQKSQACLPCLHLLPLSGSEGGCKRTQHAQHYPEKMVENIVKALCRNARDPTMPKDLPHGKGRHG